MLFKKDELKILWAFYLASFIFGLTTMISAFLIIYFRNLGLSFFQISIITAAFSITMFLLEIPTGAFADSISRKYSVILGFTIAGTATMFMPFTTNFYFMIILWSLVAAGMTFVSGALEAFVIDNLNYLKRKDLHHEYFIKSKSLGALGFVFAPVIGAFIIKTNSINILWYVLGLGFLINTFVLLLFCKEHFKPKIKSIKKVIQDTIKNGKESLKFSYTHKTVFLLIMGALFFELMNAGGIGWQPMFVELSMPMHYLGYVYSIMATFAIIMPFMSRTLQKYKIKYSISIIIFILMLSMFSLLLLSKTQYIIAVIIYITGSALLSLTNPLIQTYFHKFVPSKIRATVTSTQNMLVQLAIAVGTLIAGHFMDIYGPRNVIAFSSFFGIITIIMYLKIKEK